MDAHCTRNEEEATAGERRRHGQGRELQNRKGEDGYYLLQTNNGQADLTGEFMFGSHRLNVEEPITHDLML